MFLPTANPNPKDGVPNPDPHGRSGHTCSAVRSLAFLPDGPSGLVLLSGGPGELMVTTKLPDPRVVYEEAEVYAETEASDAQQVLHAVPGLASLDANPHGWVALGFHDGTVALSSVTALDRFPLVPLHPPVHRAAS